MMDQALKTHKETTFGWLLALQQLWSRVSAPPAPPVRRRYLAPR